MNKLVSQFQSISRIIGRAELHLKFLRFSYFAHQLLYCLKFFSLCLLRFPLELRRVPIERTE